jgi:hypothetical protein
MAEAERHGDSGNRTHFGIGTRAFAWLILLAAVPLLLATQRLEAAPRILPAGKLPADSRLAPPKDLDGYFPFKPSASVDEWRERAKFVKRQLSVSLGLWPMPLPTPLNPVIHGKVVRDGYTVERVYFESFPGFFVTGNLYRPAGKNGNSGKYPGVLCPHGHWPNGRFFDMGLDAVRREIVDGAERFEEGGRSVLQARCVTLARMGCVVFHYDMIGYADSIQIPFELAHGFSKQRPEMNTPENWGLFSPRAEANAQSVMGLQTYNSIRSLDFLVSLPDVDTTRIGVTGASGGGTQTMILGALDSRPAVIYPAVMVSTAMQGGCTCENCSLLRIDTGNVEFAALFAPKPQGLSSANDWTREMDTKGFPELKKHYALLGAADNVMLKATVHFGHNYNYVNRAAMYGWFNKHLQLGLPSPIIEEDYRRLSREEMTVWDKQHPAPPSGPDFERQLLRVWTADARRQLAEAAPRDAASLERYRALAGGGVTALIGRTLPAASDMSFTETANAAGDGYRWLGGLLRHKTRGEELPLSLLVPERPNGRVALWLDNEGKAAQFTDANVPVPEVLELLKAGITVAGVDLLFQGEFLANGQPLVAAPKVANPREFAGYTLGFNHSIFASRVHDLLAAVAYLRARDPQTKRVDVVALDETAAVAIAARVVAGGAIDTLAVNTHGFRFGKLDNFRDPNFLPGGAKYDDLPGMLALGAPHTLWLAGEGPESPPLVAGAYAAAKASGALAVFPGSAANTTAAVVKRLRE